MEQSGAAKRSLKAVRLARRKPRITEQFNNLACKLRLLSRWCGEVPAVPEPSVDGSHHPGVASAIECVDSFAEPSCTNEQRLEAHVVDGHCREDTTPLREPFAGPATRAPGARRTSGRKTPVEAVAIAMTTVAASRVPPRPHLRASAVLLEAPAGCGPNSDERGRSHGASRSHA
jgi:hypothetical protein